MICGIVAVDKNFGIGKTNKETGKGELLFNLKKDMQFFKQVTIDNIVFCGYNTLLSFPGSKPLKGRSTICLCPEGIERDDCFCVHNFQEAVKLLKELAKTKDVFVIGGAMTYAAMLEYCQEVFVTKVDADGEAEVFFPNLDENTEFVGKPIGESTQDGDYTIRFWKYTRVLEDKN